MPTKTISDPRYAELLARLRAARERRGVTQAGLAEAIGRDQSFVSKVESRERRLDVVELVDICRALGVVFREVLPPGTEDVLGETDG